MSEILVTGSRGFIGKNLISFFDKDINIIHLEDEKLNQANWKEEWQNFLTLNKPEVIFHVGACSDTLEQNVNFMMQRNYETTKFLVDWCVRNNVPIIYSSSAANYGINGDYPSNLYGWSKYVAENYVLANFGIALRYFNVYGPHEDHKEKMASVAYQMYKRNKVNKECKLFPGEPQRDFVYVKDVVRANLWAWANYSDFSGRCYDVGSGIARKFEDVMNLMDLKFGYHPRSVIPDGYQFYTCSDKKKWLPLWTPQFDLEDGIKDYKNFLYKKERK